MRLASEDVMQRVELRVGDVAVNVALEAEEAAVLAEAYRGFVQPTLGDAWSIDARFVPREELSVNDARLVLDRSVVPWTLASKAYSALIYPDSRSVALSYTTRYEMVGDGVSPGLHMALKACISFIAMLDGGLALHASGVALEGAGLVFMGPSEAGKTTIAEQLERAAGAVVLADDVVLVSADGMLHSTPFSGVGKSPRHRVHYSVRLSGAFALTHNRNDGVTKLPQSDAYRLLAQALLAPHGDALLEQELLECADALVAKVAWHTIGFDLDAEATARSVRAWLAPSR